VGGFVKRSEAFSANAAATRPDRCACKQAILHKTGHKRAQSKRNVERCLYQKTREFALNHIKDQNQRKAFEIELTEFLTNENTKEVLIEQENQEHMKN